MHFAVRPCIKNLQWCDLCSDTSHEVFRNSASPHYLWRLSAVSMVADIYMYLADCWMSTRVVWPQECTIVNKPWYLARKRVEGLGSRVSKLCIIHNQFCAPKTNNDSFVWNLHFSTPHFSLMWCRGTLSYPGHCRFASSAENDSHARAGVRS